MVWNVHFEYALKVSHHHLCTDMNSKSPLTFHENHINGGGSGGERDLTSFQDMPDFHRSAVSAGENIQVNVPFRDHLNPFWKSRGCMCSHRSLQVSFIMASWWWVLQTRWRWFHYWVEGTKVLRHFPGIWVFRHYGMWVSIWLCDTGSK